MALYGIKDSGTIILKNNAMNKVVLKADYANKLDINFSSSPVYALKRGVRAISWDGQRTGDMSMSAQVFDLQWIALLLGSEFKSASTTDKISESKVITVANATATFTGEIVSGTLSVYKLQSDNITHDMEYTASTESAIPEGKYKISSSGSGDETTNTLTFATGETGKFVVYYLKPATTDNKKFDVEIDKYPSGYSMYFDTTIKADGTGVEEMVQVYMGNVKPQSNLSLTFDSENPATLDIKFDILADANNKMLEFTTL